MTTMPAMRAAVPPALPADVRRLRALARAASALALLALLALGGAWVLRQPWLALRGIDVAGGTAHVSESSVRAHAVPRLAGNFATLSLRDARAAFEAVPWVRRASVQRVWPMRLAVTIEEHRPAARWVAVDAPGMRRVADRAQADDDARDAGDDDRDERLVNHFGEVFDVDPADLGDAADALPRLAGPEGSAVRVLAMHALLSPVLARLDGGALESLALSPRGSWHARLAGGATLELGRGSADEVLARTERFVATMPEVWSAYERRALRSADLRHGGGFALRLQGIETTPPPPPGTPAARPARARAAAARPAPTPAPARQR